MKHKILLLVFLGFAFTNLGYAGNISYKDINMDSPLSLTYGDSLQITMDSMACGDTVATLRLLTPITVSHYSWVKVGTSTPILEDTAVCVVTDTGRYRVQYFQPVPFGTPQSRVSNQIVVSFYDSIEVGPISCSDTDLCEGGSCTLNLGSITGGSSNNFITWQKRYNGIVTDLLVNGDTTYLVSSLEDTTEFRAIVTSPEGCYGSDTTDWITINTYPILRSPAIALLNPPACGDQLANLYILQQPYYDCCTSYVSSIVKQWKKNLNNEGWSNLGQDGDTISVSDDGWYRLECSLTGSTEVVYSEPVYVRFPPQINAGVLSSETVCYHQPDTVVFVSLPLGGTRPFSYSWIVDNQPVANTLDYYVTDSLTAATHIKVIVTDSVGCTDSTETDIMVRSRLQKSIIEADSDLVCNDSCAWIRRMTPPYPEGCSGESDVINDVWQVMENNQWVDLPDSVAQDTSCRVTSSGWYRLKNIIEQDSVVSDSIHITIYHPLIAGTLNTSAIDTVCYGSPATVAFSSLPSGGGSEYTYIWQQRSADDRTIQTVDTSTTASLYIDSLLSTTMVRAIVTSNDPCDMVDSTPWVRIPVYPLISSVISLDTPACGARTAFISMVEPPYNDSCFNNSLYRVQYQWQWQEYDGGVWRPSRADSIESPNLITTIPGYYRLRTSVVGMQDTTYSNQVHVVFREAADSAFLTSNLENNQTCPNRSVMLDLHQKPLTSNTYSYTFQEKVGTGGPVIIGNTNDTTFFIDNIATSTRYRAIVNADNGCKDTTDWLRIDVIPNLVKPAVLTVDTITCSDTAATIRVQTPPVACDSSVTFTYRWQRKEGNRWLVYDSISTDSVQVTESGYYRLLSIANSGRAISDSVFVQLPDSIKAGSLTVDTQDTICYNQQVTLSFATQPYGGIGSYLYTWYKKENGTISEVLNDPSADTLTLTLTQSADFMVVVYDTCNHEDSTKWFPIVVLPELEPVQIYGDLFPCRFSELPYVINTDPLDSTSTYTWFVAGGDIISREKDDTVFVRWTDTAGAYGYLTLVRRSQYGCLATTIAKIEFKNIPETPQIVRKGSSNILMISNYAQDVYYQWGKELDGTIVWETGPYASDRYYEFDDINSGIYKYVAMAQLGKKYNEDSCMVYTIWDGDTAVYPETNEEMEMTIAPNPAIHYFDISLNRSVESNMVVKIYNNVGQTIMVQTIENYEEGTPIRIDRHLMSGIYTVSIQTSNFVINKKVIVK